LALFATPVLMATIIAQYTIIAKQVSSLSAWQTSTLQAKASRVWLLVELLFALRVS
jgi:hypothetical protein